MLTARSDTVDKVIGLEVGADDYLTKPFDPSELVARVRAQMRRIQEYQSSPTQSENVSFGEVTVNYEKRDVVLRGEPVGLTNREFELVAFLAENRERAISRETLFEKVWGYEMEFNTNSLDVYIYRIRKKIEADPNHPLYLVTMRGYGYKIVAP
jgi:two-component system alkaline phosphatase synthesis response regulator PhoP